MRSSNLIAELSSLLSSSPCGTVRARLLGFNFSSVLLWAADVFFVLQLFFVVFDALQYSWSLPPLGRVHYHSVLNNVSEKLVHILQRLLVILEMNYIVYFVRVITRKHRLQRDHLIENHSKRPQICPEIVLTLDPFWRGVSDSQKLGR